jgi:N-acetylneuraminic acid mutarotase
MKKYALLFCLLSIVSSNTSAQSAWTQKADCGGGMRWHAISFSIGDKGYVGLGENSGGYAKDFWEYNPATNSWTKKANFPGATRNDGIAFSIGSKGYVGLGNDTIGHLINEVWEYDTLTNAWTQKANFPMAGGSGFFSFSIGNKGYVGSGAVFEYDPMTDIWVQKSNMPAATDPGRSGAVGFSIGNKGYMGLGIDPNMFPYPAYFHDFWQYDPLTDTWIQKAYFPGVARIAVVGFSINGKGYIGTGQDKDNNWYSDFYQYDTLTNFWVKKENVGVGIKRYYSFGFSIGDKGYIGGGSTWDTVGIYHSKDFWEYNPALDSLTDISNITSQSIGFSIYPNPSTNQLIVECNNEMTIISIMDVSGKILIRYYPRKTCISVDISKLAKGLYFIELSTEEGNVVRKFVKE